MKISVNLSQQKKIFLKETIKGEISLGGIHIGMCDTNKSVPLLNKI